jgi:hypothetical protein
MEIAGLKHRKPSILARRIADGHREGMLVVTQAA